MPALLAVALVVVPLALGGASGHALRRRRTSRAIASLLAVLAVAVTPLALVTMRVGLQDGLCTGTFLATGMLAGRAGLAQHTRELALGALVTLLALSLGELAVDVLAPPPPAPPSLDDARVIIPRPDTRRPWTSAQAGVVPDAQGLGACSCMHPELDAGCYDARTAHVPAGGPIVLFTGDSMTAGLGVREDEAFPARVAALLDGIASVNAAWPSTSIDYDAALLEPWLARLGDRVRLVVLGAFVNDVAELDRPDACCANEPLLARDATGARVRCATARFAPGEGTSLAWFARVSPAPYPLRALATVSLLAAHLRARLEPIPAAPREPIDTLDARLRDTFALVARIAARHRVPVVVLLVPYREALRGTPAVALMATARARLGNAARAAGLPVLDPFEHFRELAAHDGDRAFFLADRDVHFAPRGHEAMAAWLAPRLAPWLDARPRE